MVLPPSNVSTSISVPRVPPRPAPPRRSRHHQLAYLSSHVVDEALHAGLHAHRVLTWQQLGVPEAVEADAAGQQLLQLVRHLAAGGRAAGREETSIRTQL